MSKPILYQNLDHIPRESSVLKARTCCKTGCLHCPYGFVIKKFGLKFHELDILDESELQALLQELNIDLSEYSDLKIKLISLKEVVCGIMVHNHIVIKHLFLLQPFQEQTISKELAESYFFY